MSVVTGYFGDRLAQMAMRYDAEVTRVEAEWGRAVDPSLVKQALASSGASIVTIVHAETSTGVRNPVKELAAIAREYGALTVVDTVTMGTVLVITGVTKRDRSQVIYNGALRWAYSAYLSKTKPSTDAGAGSSDGGSLGWIERGQTVPEFETYLANFVFKESAQRFN